MCCHFVVGSLVIFACHAQHHVLITSAQHFDHTTTIHLKSMYPCWEHSLLHTTRIRLHTTQIRLDFLSQYHICWDVASCCIFDQEEEMKVFLCAGKKIYVMGGFDGDDWLKTVEMYEPGAG